MRNRIMAAQPVTRRTSIAHFRVLRPHNLNCSRPTKICHRTTCPHTNRNEWISHNQEQSPPLPVETRLTLTYTTTLPKDEALQKQTSLGIHNASSSSQPKPRSYTGFQVWTNLPSPRLNSTLIITNPNLTQLYSKHSLLSFPKSYMRGLDAVFAPLPLHTMTENPGSKNYRFPYGRNWKHSTRALRVHPLR